MADPAGGDLSPFPRSGRWYRGNVHGHTTESDGTFTPAEYAAWYREHGYDFVSVTDHWKRTDMSAFVDARFAWIPGVELDGRGAPGRVHHVLGLGVDSLPPRKAAATLRRTVEAIRSRGGLAVVAHPYWSGQSATDLLAAGPAAAIEVYNGTCDARWGKGLAAVQWDELLQRGRMVWALASDDAHHRPDQGDDLGKAWVMVRAEALTAPTLLQAIAAGHFYGSTGPRIDGLQVVRAESGDQGPLASVQCSPCLRVNFVCDAFLGRTVHAAAGELLTEATLRLHPAASYLRVECVDEVGRTAWTMPVALGGRGLR